MNAIPEIPERYRRRAAKLSVEERRTQLLACAIKVFSRKGIASAGHADLAAEAGVSVPTVFSYFPTRVALVEAVIDEVERFFLERGRVAMASCYTAQEQLTASLRVFRESLDTHPDYPKIWVNWSTSFYEKTWPLYQRSMDRTIQFHREIIQAGLERGEVLQNVDPQVSAYRFVGAATVFVLMKMQGLDSESISRYLDTTMRGGAPLQPLAILRSTEAMSDMAAGAAHPGK
jgi:TetR/AcrR family hemagglutinin/protease transcriptional regulator